MLLSPDYLAQQKELHSKGNYGISGHKHADQVKWLAAQMGTRDILDYGAGRRTLESALGFEISNYDPCIPGIDVAPESADLVCCTDCLEHIEPDYLDSVLDDLARLTKRAAYLVIATRPAKKILPDGRNAHLIQEGVRWWFPKILARFELLSFSIKKTDLHFVCEKLHA